jgi:hypothetical protein
LPVFSNRHPATAQIIHLIEKFQARFVAAVAALLARIHTELLKRLDTGSISSVVSMTVFVGVSMNRLRCANEKDRCSMLPAF